MTTFQNYQIANNAKGLLDAGIATDGDTLIVKAEYADLFPAHNGTTDKDYLLTLEHLDDSFNVLKREIVKVIAKTSNVFTITRSAGYCPASYDAETQTNTAFSFIAGDSVSMNIVAENEKDIKDEIVRQDLVDVDIYTYGTNRGRIRKAVSGNALKIDIGAFAYRIGASEGLYAGATEIAVTDNATNYIMIDSTGTIQISTSARNINYGSLGTVVCSGGVVTTIAIYKPDLVGGQLGGAVIPYNTKTAKTAGTTYQASSKGGFLVYTGSLADLAQGFIVYSDANATPTTNVGQSLIVTNGYGVYDTVSVPILPNHYYKVVKDGSITTVVYNFYENV